LENATISGEVVRGYIDVMIIRALQDGDSYGYEISKRITSISRGSYSIKETTLYSAFSRMEKQKLLRSYPGTYSGGRERVYYTLTEAGRRHYRRKREEWALTKALIANFITDEEEKIGRD